MGKKRFFDVEITIGRLEADRIQWFQKENERQSFEDICNQFERYNKFDV